MSDIYSQEDKSFELRALRRVLGSRFHPDGDNNEEVLFKDKNDIEDEKYEV